MWWVVLLTLCGWALPLHTAKARASGTVRLTDKTSQIKLGRSLEILEDKDGKLTLAEVSSANLASRFKPSSVDVPNFGFTSSVYWVRFTLLSEAKTRRDWLLEVGYPLLDHIELYVEQKGGRFEKRVAGDRLPFHKREIKHRNFVFRIPLSPGQRRQIYLRVENRSSMQIPLTLWSQPAFLAKDHEEQAILFAFYGLMAVMAVYNLFIWFSVRGRSYIVYVTYIVLSALFQMSLNGLAFEYLWPNATWWASVSIPCLLGLGMIALIWFTRLFVSTPKVSPRLDKVLLLVMGVCCLGSLLSLIGSYRIAIKVAVLGAAVGVVVITFTAAFATYKGFRPARYLLIAFLLFCIGVFLQAMKAFGLLPSNFLTTYGNQFGSAAEVVLLSFALADRINVLKAESQEAQLRATEVERKAADLEREAKENLEQEVDRQTEALRDANQRLQAVDRQKTQFFQNISHELRTPLTVLMTPLDRLIESDLHTAPQQKSKEQLRAMHRNANRLLRLVNQLLDVSRLEAGKATVSFERRDMPVFVHPIVDGFQSFAVARELRLDMRSADDLPEPFIDEEHLDTVLCNLLSNSCKFTDPGGAVLVKLDATDTHFTISVKDTGIGISPADLEHIFDRFQQADDAEYRPQQGSGIGLALSKELVELMGGTLAVESERGFGTTFTVSLPLGSDHVKQLRKKSASDAETDPKTGGGHRQELAGRAALALSAEMGLSLGGPDEASPTTADDRELPLVLVVEDNADMRALMVDICREEFRVMEAEHGIEALELLNQRPTEDLPALVISDVMMPRMDGHQLLVELRNSTTLAQIPVMLITAKAGPDQRISGLQSGADEYLTKPFDSRELIARAHNLVHLKRQDRELVKLNQRLTVLNRELEGELKRQAGDADRSRLLARYLAHPLVQLVLNDKSAEPPVVSHDRRKLVVFRAELRDFDACTETVEGEDLAELVNQYLKEVLRIASAHGATVDHFARDCIAGFFGAPQSEGGSDDALRCARMAKDLWEQTSRLVGGWKKVLGDALPRPTVVLHAGYATVGNFGSETQLGYTAVGAAVRETDALLRSAQAGEVLCTSAVQVLAGEELGGEECGTVQLGAHGGSPTQVIRLAGTGPRHLDTPSSDTPGTGSGHTPRSFQSIQIEPGIVLTGGTPELDTGVLVTNRYRIVSRLGSGGMGTVYRAHDETLDLDVALKLIRPDLAADHERLTRLRKEVRLSRRVTHRNIARIFDIGQWEGGEFVSMEYLEGETLSAHLARVGPLPLNEAQDILKQLCAGLATAHEVQVIHRDLKPSNIMLEASGRAVVLDFGIARAFAGAEMTHTETRELMGTPQYMAPEQVRGGQVDHRADIYALGVVAFEMVTGRPPFQSDNPMSVAFMHVTEPPPNPVDLRSELPPRIAALILRCLEKDVASRFGSADEIIRLLEVS